MSSSATSIALDRPSLARRLSVFAYGVVCYALGVSGLVWLILCTLGVVPFTGGPIHLQSQTAAIVFNVALVALFGVQHGIMARPAFKARWTKIVPHPMERSTFTMLAGVIMATAMALWQPMDTVIWSVETPILAWTLTGLCALGWVYLLAATFAIDHFELFGLSQVTAYLRNREASSPAFVKRFMYRFDRHPIMTGVLFGVWATPVMRLDHLVLALAFTTFITIAVAIEERDLVRLHGDAYRRYREEVGTLVPRVLQLD